MISANDQSRHLELTLREQQPYAFAPAESLPSRSDEKVHSRYRAQQKPIERGHSREFAGCRIPHTKTDIGESPRRLGQQFYLVGEERVA